MSYFFQQVLYISGEKHFTARLSCLAYFRVELGNRGEI